MRADVADGSLADIRRARADVRSAPRSGHQSHAPSCPFGPEPDIPRWHRVHRQRRDRPPIRRVPIDTIETRISLR